MFEAAERSVWVSTYAYFDGSKVFEGLARRMETRTGLRVTLLLNIRRKAGDTAAADEFVRRFAWRFWTADWPGSPRPRVYYDGSFAVLVIKHPKLNITLSSLQVPVLYGHLAWPV